MRAEVRAHRFVMSNRATVGAALGPAVALSASLHLLDISNASGRARLSELGADRDGTTRVSNCKRIRSISSNHRMNKILVGTLER